MRPASSARTTSATATSRCPPSTVSTRADITSNTFWDWQLNHVGGIYGMMDDVFQFVATFKEFPPRSFPPSFNPANVMESVINGMKEDQRLKGNLDLDRTRGGLN